jgi:UDP-N-acetylglucosamine 2-epimerase (non-hydrolysing)
MIAVAVVMGTRPEAVKLAPVIAALRARPSSFTCLTVATAQHRELLDQVLAAFAIHPDVDLDIMSLGQPLSRVAALVLERLDPVLVRERPDWVLVQGDTTTVMAAALAAFHRGARVGHVEAGLRTGDRRNPFPEEINRRVADVVADLHFAPTEGARQALLREGVQPWRVSVTGNTVIDALLAVAAQPAPPPPEALAAVWNTDRRLVLVTAHRRESFGAPLQDMLLAVRDLAEGFRADTTMVYPVHPNPNVSGPAREVLGASPNVVLLPPLGYAEFVHLMRRSTLILTDSGGVQEEAPSLGKPVLVMRAVTERPEGVAAGTALVVGTERGHIVGAAARLLTDPAAYGRMAGAVNPYGDGMAAARIVDLIQAHHERRGSAPGGPAS